MPKHIDLTGQRIGHVSVTKLIGTDSRMTTVWECLCDCGKIFFTRGIYLHRQAENQSCGCRTKAAQSRPKTHGHFGGPTYNSWQSMKNRCLNPRAIAFYNYGGRGITICERWLKFSNFLADMGARPSGTTLERKDHNGHYEPSNCIWADRQTQARNKRSARLITINGVTKCIAEWATQYGLHPSTIWYRLLAGDSGERVIRPARIGNYRQKKSPIKSA